MLCFQVLTQCPSVGLTNEYPALFGEDYTYPETCFSGNRYTVRVDNRQPHKRDAAYYLYYNGDGKLPYWMDRERNNCAELTFLELQTESQDVIRNFVYEGDLSGFDRKRRKMVKVCVSVNRDFTRVGKFYRVDVSVRVARTKWTGRLRTLSMQEIVDIATEVCEKALKPSADMA